MANQSGGQTKTEMLAAIQAMVDLVPDPSTVLMQIHMHPENPEFIRIRDATTPSERGEAPSFYRRTLTTNDSLPKNVQVYVFVDWSLEIHVVEEKTAQIIKLPAPAGFALTPFEALDIATPMKIEEDAPARTAYEDLVHTLRGDGLRGDGLPTPRIPVVLREALMKDTWSGLEVQRDWSWSTRHGVKPQAMYMFREYVQEVVDGPVEDYVAVSHHGHGLNSYGLNMNLVYGPLALFVQHSWGGVYTNPASSRSAIRRTYNLLNTLIDFVDMNPEHILLPPPGARRIVAQLSSFRGCCNYAILSSDPGAKVNWIECKDEYQLIGALRHELRRGL